MRGLKILIIFAMVTTRSRQGSAFNVDIFHPIIFHDNSQGRSYFGFSVGLLINNEDSWVLVGAPRANSTRDPEVVEPGVIYSCKVSELQCQEIILQDAVNPSDSHETLGYEEKRDNAWLGVSLDVGDDDSKPNVVACGHLWKNQFDPEDWKLNGVCYTIDSQLNIDTIRGLLPLVDLTKQVDVKRNIYLYSIGMAGFSSHFVKNTNDLILGAPGVQNLKGTIVYSQESEYSRSNHDQNFHIPIVTKNRPDDTYIGYSVSSGSFFNSSDVQLVTGAPRDGIAGSVYIIKIPNGKNQEFTSLLKLEGKQMGEYFGSCVCAVDFNGDKLTDLLVGAPLHSVQVDEGKVYIYTSSAGGGLVLSEKVGSTVYGARFGTSISNVGDLDRDGFQDVAIGAPYEETGAVYLYRGSSKGLSLSQKLLASEINEKIRGFGISISKGKDVDKNLYSDLSIGAYESGHAVLLRSFPIVSLQGSLEFNISEISTINSTCQFQDERTVCFSVKACFRFSGLDGPNEIVVTYTLTVDTGMQNETRSFLVSGDDAVSSVREDATLDKNSLECKSYDVHVRNATFDILTPIIVDLKFELEKDPRKEISFCKDCPVSKPDETSTISESLPFSINCGTDDVCNADLDVQARVLGFNSDVPLILGEPKVITLVIEVENKGTEPAYLARVSISIPQDTTFPRLDVKCHELENEIESLCDLGNPLNAGEKVVLERIIDVSALKLPLKFIQFIVNATTTSNDINNDNDIVYLNIPVQTEVDITVFGLTQNEQIRLTKDEPINENASNSVVIQHTFQVWNKGRSSVNSVTLEANIPMTPFVTVLSAEPRLNGQLSSLGSCTGHSNLENPNEDITLTFLYTETFVSVDCETLPCMKIQCRFGPFVNGEVATLNIAMEIQFSPLRLIIRDKDAVRIVTRGNVTINDPHIEQPHNHSPDEAQVVTEFIKEGAPRPKKLPEWVIPLCIVGGVLLLLLIILLLYKIGFFRRKAKEELEKLTDDPDRSDGLLNHSQTENNSDLET